MQSKCLKSVAKSPLQKFRNSILNLSNPFKFLLRPRPKSSLVHWRFPTLFSTLQGRVTCSPSAAVWSGGSRMNFCTVTTEEEKEEEEMITSVVKCRVTRFVSMFLLVVNQRLELTNGFYCVQLNYLCFMSSIICQCSNLIKSSQSECNLYFNLNETRWDERSERCFCFKQTHDRTGLSRKFGNKLD